MRLSMYLVLAALALLVVLAPLVYVAVGLIEDIFYLLPGGRYGP